MQLPRSWSRGTLLGWTPRLINGKSRRWRTLISTLFFMCSTDLRRSPQVKDAATDGSSVFHDIAEKRFELRFPGAAHKTNKQTKWTSKENNKSNKKEGQVCSTTFRRSASSSDSQVMLANTKNKQKTNQTTNKTNNENNNFSITLNFEQSCFRWSQERKPPSDLLKAEICFFLDFRDNAVCCYWVRDWGRGTDEWWLLVQPKQQNQLLACSGKQYKVALQFMHFKLPDSGKVEEPWDGWSTCECSSWLRDGEADESSPHTSLSQVLTSPLA